MHKSYLWIIVAILLIALALVFFTDKEEVMSPNQNSPVACTLEAKICPDGTAVGRVGPNCEFATCPGE